MTPSPLSIEVLLSPAELTEALLHEHQIAVIDVLRLTTVIGVALAAGAERIIPASGIEEAIALKGKLGPDATLLGGEREGRPIPGFDLGNSPSEYHPDAVAGRTLILASTNGSVILARSQAARRVLAASFNTLGAVARRIRSEGGTWTLVCSGKFGRPCLEDLACAGAIVDRLADALDPSEATDSDDATDGARIARDLFDRYRLDLPGLMADTAHGRYLRSIGFEADLGIAAELDTLDLVPEMIDGRIVAGPREAGIPGSGRRVSRSRKGTPVVRSAG